MYIAVLFPRHRARPGVRSLALALAVLVGVSALAFLTAPSGSPAPVLGSPSVTYSSGAGTPGLLPAINSLRAGNGPASLGATDCSLSGTDAARCIAGPSITPSAAIPVLGFQNSTESATVPPATSLGDLAWDPAANEAVYFGGWNGASATNETWVFQDGVWTDITDAADAPPARYGAAMAYDNQSGAYGVLLVGGCEAQGTGCPGNDTWLFRGGSWVNLTSEIGPAPRVANTTMATWGANGTLLFGGCSTVGCGLSDATWIFQNSSSCWATYHQSCWTDLRVAGTPPPALAEPALADDPAGGPYNGMIVLYGGYNSSCTGCVAHDYNATWLFNGYDWLNATSNFVGHPYPAAGRAGGALFWDPISQSLYLYGGVDSTTGVVYDQLWTTDLYTWLNESDLALPSPALANAAAATGFGETGAPLPALLVGGTEPDGSLSGATWVFEPSMVSDVKVAPVPVETNATANFYSNTTGGFRPTAAWATGDGGSVAAGNGTYVYRVPGTYTARLVATDLYGVRASTPYPVIVYLLSPGLIAPSTVDENAPTVFTAAPVNTTGALNFTWVFSDGTTAYGAPVTHAFAALGTASVTLTVRDATGSEASESATFAVRTPLTGTVAASPSVIDVGATTILSATGSGGDPPYAISWTLPGNRTVVGNDISYRPTAAGQFNITAAVTDATGAVWTGVLVLPVSPSLTFTATARLSGVTGGRSVSFTTSVSGGTSPYTYAWEFGDGLSSTLANPVHTYAAAGSYTVAAWVNDSGGGSYRQTLEVKVPRTSGGILWEYLGLPLLEQITIAAAIALVLGVMVALSYRRVQRARRKEAAKARKPPTTPPPSSGAPASPPSGSGPR